MINRYWVGVTPGDTTIDEWEIRMEKADWIRSGGWCWERELEIRICQLAAGRHRDRELPKRMVWLWIVSSKE